MAVAKERTERDVAHEPGGLKAEAGLRGPYGTSVRHIWPTWTLLVPVTLISAPLSLFLFLFASIFLKKLSFLDLTNIASYIPFSFRFNDVLFSDSFYLFPSHSSLVPSKSLIFLYIFFCYVHTLLAIINILGHDERRRDGASVRLARTSAPLLTGTRKCLPILLPTVARSR